MIRYLLLYALFLLFTCTLNAQAELHPCGTPAEKSPWLLAYQKSPDNYRKNGNELIYVPLTIHIVGTDAGTGYFPFTDVLRSLCELNADFAASNIYFFVEGDFNYINNTDFFDHDFENGYRMMEENNVANTLNTYIVESPAGNCGYSIYGLGIALAKSCTNLNDNTFAHELGHAFSLPHPFFGWEGTEGNYTDPAPEELENGSLVEKIDGSNCESAGDGFCDTAPDYLNFRWGCNDEGKSTRTQFDPDSVRFVSDGTLFMSYSLDRCSNRFSDDQSGAMRANLLDERQNFLYNQTPAPTIEATELAVVAPVKDDTVAVNQIVLDWEAVAGATHYYVQIGRTPNYSIVVEERIVTASEFTPTEALAIGKKHYWRVRPFNSHDHCAKSLRGTTFVTKGAVTNVAEFTADYQISVAPTVFTSLNDVNISIQTPTNEVMNATLYNIAGNVVWSQELELFAGENTRNLLADNLATGMYFLNLTNGAQRRTIKLIKQ